MRCLRLARPVRSSVSAWCWVSRSRSITVSPARAIPASTVTSAPATATSSIASNCPIVSSDSAAVANARSATSTMALNSGPGSARSARIHAAVPRASAASGASRCPRRAPRGRPAPRRRGQPGRQRLSARLPIAPAAAVAVAASAPTLTASAADEDAPIVASSQDRRETTASRSSTSAAMPAVASAQAATHGQSLAVPVSSAIAAHASAAANANRPTTARAADRAPPRRRRHRRREAPRLPPAQEAPDDPARTSRMTRVSDLPSWGSVAALRATHVSARHSARRTCDRGGRAFRDLRAGVTGSGARQDGTGSARARRGCCSRCWPRPATGGQDAQHGGGQGRGDDRLAPHRQSASISRRASSRPTTCCWSWIARPSWPSPR